MSAERHAVVVGGSVAGLMAALTLADAGWRVSLIAASARRGGHFAGLTLDEQLFDVGMVLLEFTSYNSDPTASLSSYDPHRRNDAGRFVSHVERILGSFGVSHPVETPEMRVGGRRMPDVLIANDLRGLAMLPTDTREQIARELARRDADVLSPLHPRHKTTDPLFAERSFRDVSIANHGQTLHETLLEPFCHKLVAHPTAALSALYHRIAWLPLYYPETLLDALAGRPLQLPPTRFSYPQHGSVAQLVRAIDARVTQTETIAVQTAAVEQLAMHADHVALTLSTGEVISPHRVVWAAEPDRLLELFGDPRPEGADRTSLTVASLLVESSAIRWHGSTLLIPDEPTLPFRVTNQSAAAGDDGPLTRLSCEWNAAAFDPSSPDAAEHSGNARVAETLRSLGLLADAAAVRASRIDVFRQALPVPTAGTVSRSRAVTQRLHERAPTIPCIGPAAPFGAASLNDQIVQGLAAAHALDHTFHHSS